MFNVEHKYDLLAILFFQNISIIHLLAGLKITFS